KRWEMSGRLGAGDLRAGSACAAGERPPPARSVLFPAPDAGRSLRRLVGRRESQTPAYQRTLPGNFPEEVAGRLYHGCPPARNARRNISARNAMISTTLAATTIRSMARATRYRPLAVALRSLPGGLSPRSRQNEYMLTTGRQIGERNKPRMAA